MGRKFTERGWIDLVKFFTKGRGELCLFYYFIELSFPKDCPKSRIKVEKSGSFVETYISPHLD
jgi:hypothetical protein